jgi:uncharacterized membrane protein
VADVIFALVLWRMFIAFPRPPETGRNPWHSITEMMFSDLGTNVLVVVGLIVVIIYWLQNNVLFGNLEKTDGTHTALGILQVFFLLLFLYSIRMGIDFDGSTGSKVFEGIAAAMVGLTSVGGWEYAKRKGLLSKRISKEEARRLRDRFFAEPAAALITIPFAFVGPWIWELAWLSYIPIAYLLRKRAQRFAA